MTQVVLVPGIFGCSMVDSLHRTIWPPGQTTAPIATETLVDLLLQDGTTPGGIIEEVFCAGGFYRTVLSMLRNVPGCEAHPFVYDWRLDIRTTASTLARAIATLPEEDIVLVGHSMGGLVIRWMLECGAFDNERWFGLIRRAVFVAVPHLGAPRAVMEIMGLTGFAPIVIPNWAIKALSARPDKYPSGYQLLPSPSELCVSWPGQPGKAQQTVYEALGPNLRPEGVQAAQDLYRTLDRFNVPPNIVYLLAYGRGEASTASGVLIDERGQASPGGGDGDGTVPVWSAHPGNLPAAENKFAEVEAFDADHVGILSVPSFLLKLRSWVEPAMG